MSQRRPAQKDTRPLSEIIAEAIRAGGGTKPAAKGKGKRSGNTMHDARSRRTTKAAERATRETFDPEAERRRRLYFSTKWRYVGLELTIKRKTCGCGEVYECPNRYIFIVRHHPTFGTHKEALDSHPNRVDLRHLPRAVAYLDHPIYGCPNCFPTDPNPHFTGQQLTLDLTTEGYETEGDVKT